VQAFPTSTEVVVIGGGIAGTATAYYLAKRGVPVVLCEKGRIAGEQSSRNWGWIRKQGRDPRELPAIIESLRLWQGLERELEEDLGWHQGGVTYLAESEKDLAGFERWLSFAKDYQLDSRILGPAETDTLLGQDGRRWKGALHTPSDGRAEPAKAVPAMARAFERLGGRVLTDCAVRTLETAAGRVAGVVTERGEIACRAAVCAGGVWSSLFVRNLGLVLPQLKVKASVLRTRPAPLTTQSAVWCDGVSFRRRQDGGYNVARSGAGIFNIVPDAFRWFREFLPGLRGEEQLRLRFAPRRFLEELYWPTSWRGDQETPFECSRVLDPPPDMAGLRRTLAYAREHFPELGPLEIEQAWAGMIDVTPDVIPVWSGVAGLDGFYVATGFSGHGFGIGPATGLIMSELVLDGRSRVDLEPFRLSRFTDGSKLEIFSRAV